MKKNLANLICTGLLIGNLYVPVHAKVIETKGATYKIKEADILEEIKKRASRLDLSKYKNKIRNKAYKLATVKWGFLPAKKRRSFLIDMTYTLEFDIPKVNEKGEIVGVLYPKGFKYNPLDYMQFTRKLVIFNAERKAEVEWFKKNFGKDLLTKPIISNGNVIETTKKLKRPVFILTDRLQGVLKIEKTPSIIYKYKNPKDGRYYLRVDEVPVKDIKDDKQN